MLVWSFSLAPSPVDLGVIGAPTCSTWLSLDILTGAPTANGVGTVQFVPAPPFPFVPVWNQWFVLDSPANALGITNVGRVLFGP